MFHSLDGLHKTMLSIGTFAKEDFVVDNKNLLRKNVIDLLVFSSVFAKEDVIRLEARKAIRKIAKALQIFPSSIQGFYLAIGEARISPNFTVPAVNVRCLTYDTARIIFRLMKEKAIGPVVFEIARSEIQYTDQRPDEFAVSILAAAIKEDYQGPVFLQADHCQLSARRFKEDAEKEIGVIEELIAESLAAGFYNIDIDASTLVDLQKGTLKEQQRDNYEVTSRLTKYIRSQEPQDVTVSIGGEIGHIGGKNSTAGELAAFMEGYKKLIKKSLKGISKISVQTGTSHGGVPLPDGSMAKVKIDFSVLEDTGNAAREYQLAGVVQHGASTLPNELFDQFPKCKTLEIHLATGFQNIVYETMPETLKLKLFAWVEENLQKEWETGWTKEQFIYKCRKKALGPFKEDLWQLSSSGKQPILSALEQQFRLLFEKLNVAGTKELMEAYIETEKL